MFSHSLCTANEKFYDSEDLRKTCTKTKESALCCVASAVSDRCFKCLLVDLRSDIVYRAMRLFCANFLWPNKLLLLNVPMTEFESYRRMLILVLRNLPETLKEVGGHTWMSHAVILSVRHFGDNMMSASK